jgi:hypothetical protein
MHSRRSEGVSELLQDPKMTLGTQFRVLVRVLEEARDSIRLRSWPPMGGAGRSSLDVPAAVP